MNSTVLIVGIVAIIIGYVMGRIQSRDNSRIVWQEPFDPSKVDDAIRQLLLEGKKIHAIKLYRERTGADLKRAKDDMDALEEQLKTDPGKRLGH
jgi:ribosomal protein L7/L12